MVNSGPYQLLLEKLQLLVERAMPMVVPKPFFLTLFEFVEVYDKDERLSPVVNFFNLKKSDDTKKETELGELAKIEMRQAYNTLQQLKTHEKLKSVHFFQEGLQHFEAYEKENGSIDSSAGPIAGRHGTLLHALLSIPLDELYLKNFVAQFGEKDKDGNIVRWTFAPSYDLWQEESKYIERLLPTKAWHSWDKLVSFYGIFKDYEKIRDEKLKKGEVFSTIGLNMIFEELNDVMNYKQDTKRYLREFDVGEYKIHLQRVFTHTKEVLFAGVDVGGLQKPKKNDNIITYKFDDETSTILINDKQIRFKRDTRKLSLLKLLIKKRKGVYFGEIAEELEGAGGDRNFNTKNIYYEACRSIENSFVKAGVPGFLDYNYNHAKISHLYKKLSK